MKHRNIIRSIFAAVAAAGGAWAETEPFGGYTWTYRILEDDTAEIYNGSSAAISPSPTRDLTVPDMLGGKTVTSIGYGAFYGCTNLTSVIIPDGVTNIGEYAFSSCSCLTSVTIPSSVKSIGQCAFSGCSGLTSVTIEDGVESIGQYAFDGCSGLTSVTLPTSVTSVGSGAFYGCIGLRTLTLPFVGAYRGVSSDWRSGYGTIGYLFRDDNYTSPSSSYQREGTIRTEQNGCYANIPTNLTSVVVTDAPSLGACALCNCQHLTNLTLNAGVTNVGQYAFSGCSGLTSVHISDLRHGALFHFLLLMRTRFIMRTIFISMVH